MSSDLVQDVVKGAGVSNVGRSSVLYAFTDDQVKALRTVVKAIPPKVWARTEMARAAKLSPNFLKNFLADHTRNDEELFRLYEFIFANRERISNLIKTEERALLSKLVDYPPPPPFSRLNHLFEYLVFVRAANPEFVYKFCDLFSGKYRVYRYGPDEKIHCSSIQIKSYQAKCKTPYFEHFLLEGGYLRWAKGNVLQMGMDFVFWAFIEDPATPVSNPEDVPRTITNLRRNRPVAQAHLQQNSTWRGVKTVIFPNTGMASSLDGQIGVFLSAHPLDHAYDLGPALIIERIGKRSFDKRAPCSLSKGMEDEVKPLFPKLDLEQLCVTIGGQKFRQSLRLPVGAGSK